MSRHYHHYSDGEYLYFITSTIVEWIPLLLSHRYFNVLIDAFAYCRSNKGLRLHAYVLMPNHFHIIASSEPRAALPGIMRDLKRYTSRELSRCLVEDGSRFVLRLLEQAAVTAGRNNDNTVWQAGYHPEAIYTQRFFGQKLEYLHNNPVRKGFVSAPENWLCSSAWDYVSGSTGMLEIDRLEV